MSKNKFGVKGGQGVGTQGVWGANAPQNSGGLGSEAPQNSRGSGGAKLPQGPWAYGPNKAHGPPRDQGRVSSYSSTHRLSTTSLTTNLIMNADLQDQV